MKTAVAKALVEQARWEDGSKVYSRTTNGELELWYDPSCGKLQDWNHGEPVADEAVLRVECL